MSLMTVYTSPNLVAVLSFSARGEEGIFISGDFEERHATIWVTFFEFKPLNGRWRCRLSVWHGRGRLVLSSSGEKK